MSSLHRRHQRAFQAGAAVLALGAALVLAGRVPPAAGGQLSRPDLQRVIDELVTGKGRVAPGATAFVSGPHGTWLSAAGTADVSSGAPMRPQARMRLESVSKLWVATLILQLVEQGKLGLGDTVERWLPGALPYGARITVRELLNHTSGMIDTNDIGRDPQHYVAEVRSASLRAELELVAQRLARNPGYAVSPTIWVRFAAALPLLSAPGTAYHYSNIGYIVAGQIAERAGGADLSALFQRLVIRPLHLIRSAYDPATHIGGSHAHGYAVAADGRLTDATTWTEGLGANGGIVSDAADEAHFLQALMGGKLIGPAELTELKRPAPGTSYGLGTGVDDSGCAGVAYGHVGAGAGFETSVFVSGDGSRVAVVLLNGHTTPASRSDSAIASALQQLYCAA